MRLSLISHASTPALRRAAFPLDEPIDAIGTAKAASTASALADRLPPATQVWVSTALRTLQTAEALQLTATPEPLLNDCGYGRWAGQGLAKLQEQEPAEVLTWLKDPAAAPHGGESLQALRERVAQWMDGLNTQADHVLAITHPAVIRMAILHALGAGAESFWRLDIAPLSITDVRFSNRQWTLRSMGVYLGA